MKWLNQILVKEISKKEIIALISISLTLLSLLIVVPRVFAVDYSKYIELIENSKQCLGKCWAIFRIHDLPVAVAIDQKSKFDLWYDKAMGALDLQELKFQLLKNVSYEVNVTEYNCEAIDPKCKPTGWHSETRYKLIWQDFNPLGKTIQPGKNYYIKVIGKRNIKLGANNVDWKIRFMDYEPPWAWWNSSWTRKQAIEINTSQTATEYTLNLNVTYDSNMNTSFQDLRFVNASENEELDYYIDEKVDSAWASVWVKGNFSTSNGTQMYMYYGNPSATDAGNKTATFPILYTDKDDISNWINQTGGKVAVKNNELFFYETAVSDIDLPYHIAMTTPAVYEMSYRYKVTNIAATEQFTIILDDGGLGARLTTINTPHSPDPDKFKFYESTAWQVACSGFSLDTYYKGKQVVNETAQDVDYYFLYDNGSEICSNLSRSWTGIGSPTDGDVVHVGDGGSASSTETYVSYIRVRQYIEPEPTHGFGSEEEYGAAPNVTIVSPGNTTYYISTVLLNFTVVDDDDSSLDCWKSLDSGSNQSVGSVTNNTYYSENLTALSGESHNMLITCQDASLNGSTSETWYNWYGLNISTFNGNGTILTSWNVYLANTTDDYYNSSLNNPALIEWNELPLTDVNITVNKTGFKNTTQTGNINNTMNVSEMSFSLWRLQYFYALNNNTNASIQNFTINFSNDTYSANFSTTNYNLSIGLDELPWNESVSALFTADNYNDTQEYYNINASSELNETAYLTPAGLTVTTWDEQTLSQLNFNITISNLTDSETFTNETIFHKVWNEIPNGDITITVVDVDGNYTQRKYYRTLTEESEITLKAYLLKTSEGMIVRFHIRDTSELPISNATFTGEKSINSTWTTIEQAKSDDSGVASVFLDPLATYRINIEYPGFDTFTSTIQPTSQDYRVYLERAIAVTIETLFEDVTYYILPYSMNATLQNVTFVVNCTSGELEWYGLNITHNDTSILFYQKVTGQPYGGEIQTQINLTNDTGQIFVRAFVKKENYSEYYINRTYFIWTVVPGSLSAWTLIQSLIPSSPFIAGGLTTIVTGLASLIIAAIGASFVAKRNLVGAGIAALAILGIFTFMGWFDWRIYTLIGVVVISIAFLKGGY